MGAVRVSWGLRLEGFEGDPLGHGVVFGLGAGGVEGDAGGFLGIADEAILEEILFEFFATDIGDHRAIDFDAGAEGLAAFLFHFPAESGVLDNVFFGVSEFVFFEDGADAVAPAALGFDVGGDDRCFHRIDDKKRVK